MPIIISFYGLCKTYKTLQKGKQAQKWENIYLIDGVCIYKALLQLIQIKPLALLNNLKFLDSFGLI